MATPRLRSCRAPRDWPAPPQELSVSSLLEIEECPRRWALKNASYPEIWAGRGYPVPPAVPAIAGAAIHLALARITGELVAAGCESAKGTTAVEVMRRLGGLTAIVERATLDLVFELRGNPRLAAREAVLKRAILRRLPQMRERAQKMLSRLRLGKRRADLTAMEGGGTRRPLGSGSHCEVKLRAPHMGWRGTADLLTVLDSACEIQDFKSGEPSEDHAFQLEVYALLWHRDPDLNPRATFVTRLILVYADADVEVAAPNDLQLAGLEQNLRERSHAVRNQLLERPPPARPSSEACRWCSVRQLCPEYWRSGAARMAGSTEADQDRFGDVEVEILRAQGPGMWDVRITGGCSVERGSRVKLQSDASFAELLQAGRRLRLLNTRIIDIEDFDSGDREIIVAPSVWTEHYVCDTGCDLV